MTEQERYEDPGLARRFRDWVGEAAPSAAPERLVYAVMDQVQAEPRRRVGGFRWSRVQAVWQYAALTLVIAIGVAVGTLVTREPSPGSETPAPGSSGTPTTPSASPGVVAPSLTTTLRLELTAEPGPSALRTIGSSLWVGTPDDRLLELDVRTGEELGAVAVGVEAITITPVDGLLWIGSGGDDLVWVDPSSGDVGTIAGVGGHLVLPVGESLWIGRQGEFLRIDRESLEVVGSVAVPGHAAHEPALIVGDELWATAGPEIVRLALPAGIHRGAVSLRPRALLASTDEVLVVDRGTLYRVPVRGGDVGPPVPVVDGLPDPVGEILSGDRLWVTGALPGGAGEVLEIDLTSREIVSRTPVGGGTRALTVIDGTVWVAIDTGALVRLEARP